MKKIKKAIFIVALFNLFAVLGGAGWLMTSGRVSKARVMNMSMLFNEPVAIEQAKLKAEQAEIAKALAEQEKPLPALALNTPERNLVRVELTQIDRQRLDRMKRDVDNLQATLRKERILVERDRDNLEQEKMDFELMRQRLEELEGGIQFQKSLATLTGLKPKDAKAVLSILLSEWKNEEVITYLSSMDDRKRTAILTEFLKAGEDKLAAELLESIRLRGLESTTALETSS